MSTSIHNSYQSSIISNDSEDDDEELGGCTREDLLKDLRRHLRGNSSSEESDIDPDDMEASGNPDDFESMSEEDEMERKAWAEFPLKFDED